MIAAVPMHAAAEPPAYQHMPSPLWRGVTRIALVCAADMNASLCEALVRQARTRTSLPVELVTGRKSVHAADPGLVVVTVALESDRAGRRLTAVARRALEIDDAQGPVRRSSVWSANATETQAADQLLGAILPGRSPDARRRRPDQSARPRPPIPPRSD